MCFSCQQVISRPGRPRPVIYQSQVLLVCNRPCGLCPLVYYHYYCYVMLRFCYTLDCYAFWLHWLYPTEPELSCCQFCLLHMAASLNFKMATVSTCSNQVEKHGILFQNGIAISHIYARDKNGNN